MARFPYNEIISLVGDTPRYELGESVGPDLRLEALLDPSAWVLDPSTWEQLGGMALGYGTAAGDPRLRQVLAELHGVGADDVVTTVGSMHALFLLAFLLCEPGDEAVTAAPQFPLTHNGLEAVGAKVRVLRLSFDQGYRVDLHELCGLLSEKTKLVVLASPQNPSGVAIAPDTVRVLIDVMGEKCPEARLVLDTTYREAVYGDDPAASSFLDLSPKIVCTASLSKCHGAPGLRLGWAITRDPALREQLVLGKFNTVISCPTVDEFLALKVLEQRDRIIGDRRRHLAEGLARTADWVSRNGEFVEWVRPDAGALCCVRLRPAIFDDDAVRRFHDGLAGQGVRVASGTWFGEEARVFRLGFGLLPMPELEAALDQLSAVLGQAVRS